MTIDSDEKQQQGRRALLTEWTRLPEITSALFDEPASGLQAWVRTTAGILVMLILLQVLTGVLLGFYYVPSAESAHATVSYIEKVLPAGSWIRALHHYGSQWLTLFLVLHLAQMFWRASYRRRPVGWIASVLLLALVLAGGATGYSLPWDARAFFGTRVAEGIAGGLPLIGAALRRWLLDGTEISTLTVSRFFAIHVLINPALILVVIAARLFIFRERKASSAQGAQEVSESWKPAQVTRQALMAGLVFLALALYAYKYGAPLGPDASEAAPGYLPRPGAQFLWLFQMLKYLPGRLASMVALLLPGIFFVALILLPFLDARHYRKAKAYPRRKLSTAAFALLLALSLMMTALAYINDRRDPQTSAQLARQAEEEANFRREPFEPKRTGGSQTTANAAQPAQTPATTPDKQAVSPDTPPASYMKKCASCHGAQGQGVKPFPKLLGVSSKPRRTVDDIVGLLNDPKAYNLEPPMKSFATKLTDDEKRQIAEWVVMLKKK